MMLKRDMGNTNGHQATFTKAITKTIKDIFMVKCTGAMEAFTKESGSMGFNMAMVSCHLLQGNKRKGSL